MLVNVGPLLIALLAGVLLHEGFPRQLVFGSIAAFGGDPDGLSSSEDGPRRGRLSPRRRGRVCDRVVAQKPLLASCLRWR